MNKKKLLALVLAALMSVSTTVVAFADESTPAATQNAGVSTLAEGTDFAELIKAPLADHAYGGGVQDNSLADSYSLEYTKAGENEYNVTIKAENVKLHTNGEKKLGYWVGLAVIVPEDQEIADVNWGTDSASSPVGSLETIHVDGATKSGIAYYMDASKGSEYDFAIQWKKAGGETVGSEIKFHITLDVTQAKTTIVNSEEALNTALKKGGTITLADDVTLTNPIEIGVAGTTLDLGGYSLVIGDEKSSAASTLAAHDSWVAVTAPDVIITNGTIDAQKSQDKYVVCAEQGGSVILNGVTVNSDSTTSGAVANYGTMTIESANVTGGRFAVVAGPGPNSTTIVNDGIFTNAASASDKGVVYGGADSNITLNGGSFSTTSKTAVELENGGRLTVKEGASITVSGDAEASDVFKFNGTGSLTMDEGFKAGDFTASEIQGSMKDDVKVDVVDPSEEEENDRERSGGDYFGNAKWTEVKAQIAAAEEGDTIEMSGTGLPWFPSSVARALKGKDVTLEIRKNGVTYTLNGQKIGPITKIWYNFDENLETTLQPVEE